MKFTLEKKGYNKKEVDEYLQIYISKSEETLKEQKARIDSLKKENEKLEEALKIYKEKENCVSEALVSAVNKAKEVENAVRIRFAVEGERIKLFQSKWTKHVEKIKNQILPDSEVMTLNNYLEKVKGELGESLSENLNIWKERDKTEFAAQYTEEKERIADNKMEDRDYDKFISRLKCAAEKSNNRDEEKDKALACDAFNIKEALNPGQSLLEICRDLKLISK